MKLFLQAFVLILSVGAVMVAPVLADEIKPITREEIEILGQEAMSPEVLSRQDLNEAFSKKHMVPNIRLRLVNEIQFPKMEPQVQDVTYTSLKDVLTAARGGATPDGKIYKELPRVKWELTDFEYDPVKKQADYRYKAVIEGIISLLPNMNSVTEQACHLIDERQSDGVIKTVLASCLQKIKVIPIADM